MKIDLKIRILISELTQSEEVLKRLTSRLESYEAKRVLNLSPGDEEAMVVSQLLSADYTCLKTIFCVFPGILKTIYPPIPGIKLCWTK